MLVIMSAIADAEAFRPPPWPRPRRRDGPLRHENITDIEIRWIQLTAAGLLPRALVYISGVNIVPSDGCSNGGCATKNCWRVNEATLCILIFRLRGNG
jgi:hypothetical protein